MPTTRTTPTTRCVLSGGRPALMSTDLTLEEVLQAYYNCRHSKRSAHTAIEFEQNFSENIADIYHSILDHSWQPSSHMCFVVMNPKPREVWASPFADRVVHHIIYNRLRPRFEKHWIATTFACIKGRGTVAASDWAETAARKVTRGWSQRAYFLQMDIRNFFPSIEKERLLSLLLEKCEESWLIDLVIKIILVDVTEDAHFPGNKNLLKKIPNYKSLWHSGKDYGIPIGNLTSQFGANIYLNTIDQYVVRNKLARHYGRYVDDMVLMDADKGKLEEAKCELEELLEKIKLYPHPQKTKLLPLEAGLDFCGRFIKPRRSYLRKSTSIRGTNAVRNLSLSKHPQETLTSYYALARHCSTYNLRQHWKSIAYTQGIHSDLKLTRGILV